MSIKEISELASAFSPRNLICFLREKQFKTRQDNGLNSLNLTSSQKLDNHLNDLLEKFSEPSIAGYTIIQDGTSFPVFFVSLKEGTLTERSSRKNQFDYAKKILLFASMNYDFCTLPAPCAHGIFVFADNTGHARMSLIEDMGKANSQKRYRRYTFYIDPEATNRTFIDRMCMDWSHGKSLSLNHQEEQYVSFDKIKESFSVERLSNEFFDEYKRIYQSFVVYGTGKTDIMNQFVEFGDKEKAFRDYIKKMMGRLVFLQFLAKKGWLGVPEGQDWGNGNKEYMKKLFESKPSAIQGDYLEKVLEPLFFDSLNTDRSRNRDIAADELSLEPGKTIRIPYLNGGLFEKDVLDGTKVKFPAKYFARSSEKEEEGIFDIFERFNFTIDENDPNDAEIGVDPEMLGRIFENLLEDNKDKGAFYTPKEIVSYMCQESLIQYLGESPEIRALVSELDDSGIQDEQQKKNLIEKLKEVKICDPAIGSGAFPMGMLNLLYRLRIKLGDVEDSSEDILRAKKEIIQNNIYGVDIEPGAVDIARLRFWLSIVVDEDTPTPLPNFDYKIMQGNSLLEKYNGVDLKLDLRPTNKKGEKNNTALVEQQMYLVWDDEVKALEDLKSAMNAFFDPALGENKIALRNNIDLAVKNYIKTKCGNDSQVNKDVDGMNLNNKPFFLWHLYFADVFAEQGGFDIVIGNPPYNELRDLAIPLQEMYRQSDFYEAAKGGRVNLFQFFYPLGFSLGRDGAIVSLITQNSLLGEDSALNNRKLIFSSGEILKIDSFPERDNVHKRVFESAKMSVCIANIKKKSNVSKVRNFIVNIWTDRFFSSCKTLRINYKKIMSIYPETLIIPLTSETDFDLVYKIATNSGKKIEIKCSAGEIDMTKYKQFFSKKNQSNTYRVITGAQIQRYYITDTPSQGGLIYLGKDFLQHLSKDRQKAISNSRIVMQRITGVDSLRRIIATKINAYNYCSNSTNYLSVECPENEMFILGVLNSKLFNWYIKQTSTNTNITSSVIQKFPFIDTSRAQKERISKIVESMLIENNIEKKIDLEKQLDSEVYNIYSLNSSEIKRIEFIYQDKTKDSIKTASKEETRKQYTIQSVVDDYDDARE